MAFRSLSALAALFLVLALAGCNTSAGNQDLLSPSSDLQITQVTAAGNAVVAPIVSSASSGSTSGTVMLDFPQADLQVSVFNGVSVSLSGFAVQYFKEDGTPQGIQPLQGGLAETITATFNEANPQPTVTTLRIPVVSTDLRSLFAGADGKLGTGDDYQSTVTALITLAGQDINGNTVSASARVSITAQPQASGTGQ